MATYLTLHPVRRAPNSRLASVGGYDWLSASILTGLEMFALATNGMCGAAFAHSSSEVPKAGLAELDEIASRAKRSLRQHAQKCRSSSGGGVLLPSMSSSLEWLGTSSGCITPKSDGMIRGPWNCP
jgi:hypothetical protein